MIFLFILQHNILMKKKLYFLLQSLKEYIAAPPLKPQQTNKQKRVCYNIVRVHRSENHYLFKSKYLFNIHGE